MGEAGPSNGMQDVFTSQCDGDRSYNGGSAYTNKDAQSYKWFSKKVKKVCRTVMKINSHDDSAKFLRENKRKCDDLHFYLEKAREKHHSNFREFAAREFLSAVERAKFLVEESSQNKWHLNAKELWECSQHFIEVLTVVLFWWAGIMSLGAEKRVEEAVQDPVNAKVEVKGNSEQLSEAQRELRAMVRELVQSGILKKGDPEHQLAVLLDERLNDQSIMGNPPAILQKFPLSRTINITEWFGKGPTKRGQTGIVIPFKWVYDKNFAVKMRLPNRGAAEGEFEHEYDILNKYRSPYIVGVVGYWEVNLKPFLMMEAMDFDLEGLITSRRESGQNGFSALETIKLMLPVAKALQFLHDKDVAHRDIKPKNIMCSRTRDGKSWKDFDEAIVKLIDFGDARKKVSDIPPTSIGVAGTFGYMDPAMRSKGSEGCDLFRADVFSFAIVFVELLTWRYPWEGTGIQRGPGVQEKLDAGERPLLPDDLPKYVSFIVKCCWFEDPLARPTFKDICFMLQNAKLLLDKKSPADLDNLFRYQDGECMARSIGDSQFP